MCSGNAYNGTPYTCHCHDPISGEDWFPRSQLEQSFDHLRLKLQSKLGDVDLITMFSNISPSKFPVYTLTVPQFIPGVSPFSIVIDVERFGNDYGELVMMLRYFFIGMIILMTVRIVLVTWRQY